MASKQKFNHARDRAFYKMRDYDSIQLPSKLRCDQCRKYQTPDVGFSKKKLQEVKKHIANGVFDSKDPDKIPGVTCRKCTGTQKFEMTCINCNVVKGLDGFSKAQRKTPDHARCITCYAQLDRDVPYNDTATHEFIRRLEEDESDNDSDVETNIYAESSVTGTDGGVGVAATYGWEEIEGHDALDEGIRSLQLHNKANDARDDHSPEPSENDQTFPSWPKPQGRPFTAYDSNGHGYGHGYGDSLGRSTASSVADTEEALQSATAGTASVVSRSVREPESRSRFAKVPAYKPSKRKEQPIPTYYGGRQAKADSDDEDDDEEDEYFTI